jgi:hypothetical protein
MLFAAQGLDLTDAGRDEANTLVLPEDARGLAEKRSEEERKKAAAKGPTPTGRAPTRVAPQGSGSFDVDDRGDAVAIVRRGVKSPKPKPEHLSVVPPSMDGDEPTVRAPLEARPSQPMGANETTGGRVPTRRPMFAPPPRKVEPVRFDVNSGASIEPDRRGPGAPPPRPVPRAVSAAAPRPAPAQKPAPPPQDTPEEAKRKRIDDLKAKAADAAKRAAERTQGSDPNDPNAR